MTATPGERQEKARVRRRWLTLGELLAIAGVVISALALWNSYRERAGSEAKEVAADAATRRKAATIVLKAVPDKDGRVLALTPRDDTQAIQEQVIRFPTPLALSAAETSSDARIERDWFDAALIKARKEASVRAETIGDARLLILVTTTFLADGEPHTDRAVYQVGYLTEHSFLGGTSVRLRGLTRVGAVASDAAGQARVDALWRAWVERTTAAEK